ncbi:hypothetical protein NM208_g4901 [Fusarium decemcellulare]|uniref:Uncharacterized protein n=1 Tax=Fusarium decemcellulare TaxID=57161 RepID=A0ACC1SJ07_9HYPO|nr:hypothetical protein NM208_g4901 [Fusarium decemcellulare]
MLSYANELCFHCPSRFDDANDLPAGTSILPSKPLQTSADPALTAYAELATLRLGASRALISLFDSQSQHVIAEATPFSSLKPSVPSEHGAADGRELWLCGASLPRTLSLCQRALLEPQVESPNKSSDKQSSQILPVHVIKDLATEPDSSPKLFVLGSAGDHFYAGVPIRTARGINIGVLCIFDHHPCHHFDSSCEELLRDLSATVMTHLETRRFRESHRRADRMVRGIGSFVEGSTTTSGWQGGPSMNSFVDIPDVEGSLNANQQRFKSQSAGVTVREGIIAPRAEPPEMTPGSPSYFGPRAPQHNATFSHDQSPISPQGPMPPVHPDGEMKHVFSKAANIVRESIETEGVLFLDASVSSFGRGVGKGTEETSSHSSSSSLSSDEGRGATSNATGAGRPCRILGFSTSLTSSIDGDAGRASHSSFSEDLLQRLMRHHPRGAIFNFDQDGSLQLSDLSSDEAVLVSSSVDTPSVEDAETTHQWTQGVRRRRRQSESRKRQTEAIITIDSDGLLEDLRTQRLEGRAFTVEGELSYLTAFGAVVMTQVLRTRAKMAERSKSDVLNSLSHEFRSPLHGIILGAELLRDTSLDALQGDMLHTIETCSRTLLDTIDHLLDWSRINRFRATSGAARRSTKMETNIEAGMMSIASDISLDALTEEVVESVYVGHCFQQTAADRQSKAQSSGRPIKNALQWLDSAQAVEQSTTGRDNQYQTLEDVTVSLDIASGIPWAFHAQPGALRRIIMNLVGNSLKYTSRGFVAVTLDRDPNAEPTNKRHCNIRLTVADSGCGMSDDYLKNDVFTPFAQGHTLTPGTGLGLPLVKRIVRTLGGTITMESNIGEGTRVVVKVPIELAPSSVSTPTTPPHTNVSEFRELVDNLKGLRVQLLGFPKRSSQVDVFGTNLDEHDAMTRICRDWLLMEIVDAAETNTLRPDLVLYDPRYFAEYVENQHNNEMVPAVVICRSALAARQLAANYSQVLPEQTDRQLEFISQPVGPRKLARVLSLVFLRWMALQTSTTASPALLMASTERLRPLGGSQGSHIRLSAANSSDSGVSGPGALQRRAGSSVSSIGDLRSRLLQSPLPNVIGNGGLNQSIHSQETAEDDPTFLLVEDNLINMRMLMAFMKKLGLPYETATDGQQAVDKFRERPGRFGNDDTSGPLRPRGRLIRCAILALTGLASDDAQQEAFASGVDLFLTKPVKLVELSQILTSRGLGDVTAATLTSWNIVPGLIDCQLYILWCLSKLQTSIVIFKYEETTKDSQSKLGQLNNMTVYRAETSEQYNSGVVATVDCRCAGDGDEDQEGNVGLATSDWFKITSVQKQNCACALQDAGPIRCDGWALSRLVDGSAEQGPRAPRITDASAAILRRQQNGKPALAIIILNSYSFSSLKLNIGRKRFYPSWVFTPGRIHDCNESTYVNATTMPGVAHIARCDQCRQAKKKCDGLKPECGRCRRLGLPDQGASCDEGKKQDAATFYLKNGELFLYKTDNPPQQVYADRSGMGQGRVGYITGAQPPPRNAELTGWEIDSDENITLEGASLKACLGANDAWVVWVSVGSANPPGYDECLGFTARTGYIENPVSCLYTQQS